jgi:hypothetical protein
MTDSQKRDKENSETPLQRDKSFPNFQDLTENTTNKQLVQEENRMEADLEDKQPAGDGGPEDD